MTLETCSPRAALFTEPRATALTFRVPANAASDERVSVIVADAEPVAHIASVNADVIDD